MNILRMPDKIDLKFNKTMSADYESDKSKINKEEKNMIVQKGGELPPSAIAGIVIVSIIVLIIIIFERQPFRNKSSILLCGPYVFRKKNIAVW